MNNLILAKPCDFVIKYSKATSTSLIKKLSLATSTLQGTYRQVLPSFFKFFTQIREIILYLWGKYNFLRGVGRRNDFQENMHLLVHC